MSEEEKAILHRVKLYVGKTLVNVVPDLLELPAQVLIEEWLDVDLDRHAECDTLKCGCNDETIIDDEELALTTPMSVYMVATGLGIINVVAPNEITALGAVGKMLEAVNERLDTNITGSEITPEARVHVITDDMGIIYNALTVDDLIQAYQTPFEE